MVSKSRLGLLFGAILLFVVLSACALFINGQMVQGAVSLEALERHFDPYPK